MKVLLVNPPVYDFAAYDFWLKPYGLLSVGGFLRGRAELHLFDYMDRQSQFMQATGRCGSDQWGRGKFSCEEVERPVFFRGIRRHFRRFGVPRAIFRDYLRAEGPFDFVLVQTMMTYWYPGVREVIEDIRRSAGQARIVLGGNYATLCTAHAEQLGADLVVSGTDLGPVWDFLAVKPDMDQPGFWQGYEKLTAGVLKLTQGCPFSCSYCSVPQVYGRFQPRSLDRSLAELELIVGRGATDVAFYDDALLYRADEVISPFLRQVSKRGINVNFHCPNALNARFITADLAQSMAEAGFKTFFLGFECVRRHVQEATGGKVYSDELAAAVDHLAAAGVDLRNVTAYQILGHPQMLAEDVADSMKFVRSLGIRGMLADYSPIPGTPDGDACASIVDMNEPLMHNKTAFAIIAMGPEVVDELKQMQTALNREVMG